MKWTGNLSYLALIFFIVIINSCNKIGPVPVEDSNSQLIRINFETEKEIKLSDIASEIEYVPLKADELIGSIRKIISNEKYFGFFDYSKKAIWLFNKDGEYQRDIKIPNGRGPGELEYFSDIVFGDNNNIFAVGLFKIIEFNTEGKILNEITLPYIAPKATYLSDSNLLVLYLSNQQYNPKFTGDKNYNLLFLDEEGELVDYSLPITFEQKQASYYIGNNFPKFGSQQLFFGYIDYNIYEISNNVVKVKYRLDFGENSFTNASFEGKEKYIGQETKFIHEKITGHDYIVNIGPILEIDDYVIVRFFRKRNQVYHAFYNKNSKQTLLLNQIKNDLDNGFFPFLIHSSSPNTLMGIIEPYQLIDHVEKLKQSDRSQLNDQKTRQLLRLTEGLSRNDNPILVKITL